MKHRGTLILAVIGLGLALSASIPFIASQAAPADVVQADSLPVGVSADGLELWLQLDESAGATAFTDASRNAHTTDCTGDACPTVGVSGMFTTALRFDGVNDYLESDDFDLDDDFSISLWVNPSTTDDYQVFIGKHNSDGDNLMLFGFYNGGYYFRIRDTIYQGGTKTTGWQHLAVTGRYSDTSETAVTMFKNGQVLWQQTLNAVVGDISGGKGWSLGQDWDSSTSKTDFYGGDMDEVMVFSRTLAMTEVVALYQSAPLYPQSLHPAANAIGAALSTDISVTYGHPISPSSVTSRTFAVHGMQSGLLTGTYAVSGGAVTLIPDRPLHAGELVRASACDGILSEAGTPALPVQWQFNAGVVQERCVGVFADISAGLPGVNVGSASWGDYDNDGDLDILLTGWTDSAPYDFIARVYRNDDGVFADISAGLPGVAFGSASWGDYDNDGDLDILLTGGTGSDPARIARVYRNDDGVFSNITAGLPGVDSSAAWGDYDNDNDLDILLTGYTGSDPDRIARVYRNDDCADLAVSKRVVVPTGAGEAVTAAPGEPLTYTLAFANLGEAPAEGVVLTDSLPLGEVTGLGYTVSSGLSVILRAGTTYIWDVEDLPVGEGGTITITGVIKNPLPFGLVFTNTATIYTSSEDGDPENNHSAVTVTIQSQEDLVFLPLLQR